MRIQISFDTSTNKIIVNGHERAQIMSTVANQITQRNNSVNTSFERLN